MKFVLQSLNEQQDRSVMIPTSAVREASAGYLNYTNAGGEKGGGGFELHQTKSYEKKGV
jgi:hypothetical protein